MICFVPTMLNRIGVREYRYCVQQYQQLGPCLVCFFVLWH